MNHHGDRRIKYEETKAKIISGTVGSFLTAIAVHPLEVVKVRTQAQRTPSLSLIPCSPECVILNNGLGDCLLPKSSLDSTIASTSSSSSSSSALSSCQRPELHHRVTPARGTFGSLRHIFFQEGVGSLYAGLGPTLTMGVSSCLFVCVFVCVFVCLFVCLFIICIHLTLFFFSTTIRFSHILYYIL